MHTENTYTVAVSASKFASKNTTGVEKSTFYLSTRQTWIEEKLMLIPISHVILSAVRGSPVAFTV